MTRMTQAQWATHQRMYGRQSETPEPVLTCPLAGGILFTLPMPPRVNALYQQPTAEMVANGVNPKSKWLTDEQRDFRRDVAGIVHIACKGAPPLYPGRLHVWLRLHFSNKRHTDIDGRIKATLDSLEHAKVYKDDSQIDKLTVERVVDPDGQEYCSVEIREVA